MTAQLQLFNSAFFQDGGVLEQPKTEEVVIPRANVRAPVPNPKKEQNRVAAQKLRNKQREAKSQHESHIKRIETENTSLKHKVQKLSSELKELTDYYLTKEYQNTVPKGNLSAAVVRQKQELVLATKAAAADIVRPKPESKMQSNAAASDSFAFNIPVFLLESDNAQLPTQVDPKSKNSKIVDHDVIPIAENIQAIFDQKQTSDLLQDDSLNLGIDLSVLEDPSIFQLTDTIFNSDSGDLFNSNQQPNQAVDYQPAGMNYSIDWGTVNVLDNVLASDSNPSAYNQFQINQTNDRDAFQAPLPGNQVPVHNDPFFNGPQFNTVSMPSNLRQFNSMQMSGMPYGYYNPEMSVAKNGLQATFDPFISQSSMMDLTEWP